MNSIDDILYKMTEYQVGKKTKSSNPMGRLNISSNNTSSNNRSGKNSFSNTNTVLSSMNKSPEAMIKITGNSKDISKISSHIEYISRDGELEIKNQDNETLKGKHEITNELNAWESLGITKENGNLRESLHIIFSMPKGTDEKGLLKAVENFSNQELQDHNYLYAQHLDTKNPHVHLCLSVRDIQGNRLNLKKDDVYNWRKIFAEKLREQGIDAVATTRQQRLKVNKGYDQTIMHIDKKLNKKGSLSQVTTNRIKEINQALDGLGSIDNPYDEKVKKSINRISVNYKKLINDKNNGLSKESINNIKTLIDGYKQSKDFLTSNELLLEKIKETIKLKENASKETASKETISTVKDRER